MFGLPDPEMRKYLKNGTVEGVQAALSPQISAGLTIDSIDAESLTMGYNGDQVTVPTTQMLKHTVRAANALLGE